MIIFLSILLAINVIWSLLLHLSPVHATIWNYLFGASYAIIYFVGGAYGMWKGMSQNKTSVMGKTLIFLGLGIFFWGVGNAIWVYYNLFGNVEIPYPSAADVAYVVLYPAVAAGCFYFIKLFKPLVTKALARDAVLIIAVTAVATFYLFRPDLTAGLPFWQRFFNFFYPLGDAVLLSLALIMLRISAGKVQRGMSMLILALFVQAIADFFFTTRTSAGTYWNGDISDLLYAVSGFIFAISLIKLSSFEQEPKAT